MINYLIYVCKCIIKGFKYLSLMLVKGIYFYLYLIATFFKNVFKNSKMIDKTFKFVQQKPKSAECSLFGVFAFVVLFSMFEVFCLSTNEIVKLDSTFFTNKESNFTNASKINDKNLFKYFGNMQLKQIDLNSLKEINSDVVGWIIVDGTNINYPVVKTNNNEYYLKRNFNKKKDNSGWPFMDYKNSISMVNDNTVLYGHNLLNSTSFGSVSKIFTEEWFNESSHQIIYLNSTTLFKYEIFSVYSIVKNYNLEKGIGEDNLTYFNKLKSKSIVKFNVELNESDKIITLVSFNNDNMKVVHARMITKENY